MVKPKENCKNLVEKRRFQAEQVGSLTHTMTLVEKLTKLYAKSEDEEADHKFARIAMDTVRTSQRVCGAYLKETNADVTSASQ